MQFSSPLILISMASLAMARWHMTVAYSDGTSLEFRGETNSHCTQFKKTNADVTHIDFEGSLFADTYELYSDDNCQDLVYKGKKGSSSVPEAECGSYKVY